MAGKKRTDDEFARRRNIEDRSRNEMQKSVLLKELAKLQSTERDKLIDTACGLRKESQRIREIARELRKKRA